MAGNLIFPRVRVLWGGEDITYYKPSTDWTVGKEPQPLVYGVSVSLQEEGQSPKGSMKWNPVGKAFQEYQNVFLEKKIKEPIQIQFFYVNGRSIVFQFVWAGHQITYGTSMEIQITLGCELDGLILGNVRSTAQANDKGTTFKDGNSTILKQYKIPPEAVVYTKQAEVDTGKAKFDNTYGEDITFYEKIQQLNQANGNMVMATNIDSPGQCVIVTPYSWEKAPVVSEPTNDQSVWPPQTRYGYFLGPSIINTMVRTAEWQKPQKSQSNSSTQTPAVQPQNPNQNQQQSPPSAPQTQVATTGTTPTTAPQGNQGGKTNPDTKNKDNPDGPKKQDAMKKERGSKIAINTLLVPALLGIKPIDILYIPSFKGDYLEDWIVTGVDYQQTDGGVEVSIQGARQFGLGDLMNKTVSEGWLEKAKKLKLVGEGATLEAWEQYAWPNSLRGTPAAPTAEPPPKAPAAEPAAPGVPVPLPVDPFPNIA